MNNSKLLYLSEQKIGELQSDISKNLERYRVGDFADLVINNGWNVESDLVRVDSDLLSTLDEVNAKAGTDLESSIIVYDSLVGMTPALAMESRVWTRLTHVDCLDYSRARWPITGNEESQLKQVLVHFFAFGRTGVRDDNAVSRLWWNMHIASIADPQDPTRALSLILRSADIRQAIVERPNTAARGPLIRGLLRAIESNPWITSSESCFRRFMVELNIDGGGVLFEVGPESAVDKVMYVCAQRAHEYLEKN